MNIVEIITNTLGEFLGSLSTNLVSALLILIGGTLIAFFVSGLFGSILSKLKLDSKISGWLSSGKDHVSFPLQKIVSTTIFYFLLLATFIMFLGAFNDGTNTGPLANLLNDAVDYLPSIIQASVTSVLAMGLALIVKAIILKLFDILKVDDKINKMSSTTESSETKQFSIGSSLGNVAFWLIILFFLPRVLEPLGFGAFLTPLNNIGTQLLDYSDNVIGAIVIFAIGLFIINIIRQIVYGLLSSTGIDGFVNQSSVSKVLGNISLSDVVGKFVYFILIFTVVTQSLTVLDIQTISEPANQILSSIYSGVIALLTLSVGLGLAFYIGRILADFVTNLLNNTGFNRLFAFLGLPEQQEGVPSATTTPSQIVGYTVMVAVILFTLNILAEQLGFNVLSEQISTLIIFAGQVLLGLIIFGIGLFLANFASRTIKLSDFTQANILAVFAQVAILFISGAMALTQIGVGKEIVDLTFGILLGSIAIAFAISFGIGSKDIAARELENFIKQLKSN